VFLLEKHQNRLEGARGYEEKPHEFHL